MDGGYRCKAVVYSARPGQHLKIFIHQATRKYIIYDMETGRDIVGLPHIWFGGSYAENPEQNAERHPVLQ